MEDWCYEQIGLGVSRCPADGDQMLARAQEIEVERCMFPLFLITCTDQGHDLENQDRALGEASWIQKPLGIA